MAALEDITAELSKLTIDISSAELSHGEVCNRLLASAYRCPLGHTGNVGRPWLSVTIDQLEYFIDYDFSATDIAHMLNISVRTIQRRLQDYDLSIRASYSPVNDSELDDVIASIFKLSDDFFQLDHDVKQKYARPASGCGHGWVAFEREKVSPDRPADHKEAFNITEPCNDQRVWPDDKVPGFQKEIHSFFELCGHLSLHILHLMALGLELKDSEIFTATHKTMESTKNATTLRLLHYPCIKEEGGIKPGQIRCGEHTDYGSITLLFQDEMPGLEVLPLGCEDYIPAPPLPGAIVVNVADLMQRWTADKLKSTRHRVSIPTEECHRRVPRRSLAFFVHPDDDTLVECLDGSEKYPSITAYDYLWQRLNATYEY